MEAQNKQEYIDTWTEHLRHIRLLGLCKNRTLSDLVNKHLDALLNLVPKVAETKNWD